MANAASDTNAGAETDAEAIRGSASSYPGTPRWVKLGGIAALILVLLVVVVTLLSGGEHGPMRHIPTSSEQTHTSQTADGMRVV